MSRYRIYLTRDDKQRGRYIETDDTRPPSAAIEKALHAAGLPAGTRYYDLEKIRED